MPPRKRKTITSDDAARLERRTQVMTLRAQGRTLGQIAEHLGVARATVARDTEAAVKAALARPVEAYVGEALTDLALMREAVMPLVIGGDLGALDRALKVQERASKLLGLDAPTAVSVAVSTDDFAATAAQLMVGVGMAAPETFTRHLDRGVVIEHEGDPAPDEGVPPEQHAAEAECRDDWVTG